MAYEKFEAKLWPKVKDRIFTDDLPSVVIGDTAKLYAESHPKVYMVKGFLLIIPTKVKSVLEAFIHTEWKW